MNLYEAEQFMARIRKPYLQSIRFTIVYEQIS